MTYVEVKTKRYRTASKRRIRWDRVLSCTLVPVMAAFVVRGMASDTSRFDHAEGTDAVVTDDITNPCSTTATDYLSCSITTTTSTTQTTKNIVVDEATAGFKLKLKTCAKDMGIHGIYWSHKLERIINVRDQQILAMLVLAEGAYEPYDTQVGIAATVLNRVLYEKMFPDDIEAVVVQPHQFSPVIMRNGTSYYDEGWNGFYNNNGKEEVIWTNYPEEIRSQVLMAVYRALDGDDTTASVGGALYYCNMSQLDDSERKYRENIGASITFGRTTFYREW